MRHIRPLPIVALAVIALACRLAMAMNESAAQRGDLSGAADAAGVVAVLLFVGLMVAVATLHGEL